MKKLLALILLIIICLFAVACGDGEETSDISVDTFDPTVKGIYSDEQLYDKVLGGWAGQMAGVVYGADVEFYYRGQIMPEDAVVDFSSLNINNAFWRTQA